MVSRRWSKQWLAALIRQKPPGAHSGLRNQFRIVLLIACTVVWNDFFPILPEFAPQGMKNWRQEIQVATCAEPPTSWNPIKQCIVVVSSRLIDADDQPLSGSDGGWRLIKSTLCQAVPPMDQENPCTADGCPPGQ
jgi:hypothetical protein